MYGCLRAGGDAVPEHLSAESPAICEMLELSPLRRVRYLRQDVGEMSFELVPEADDVLLTSMHRRLIGERLILHACARWHARLVPLIAGLEGSPRASLWRLWTQLREAYRALLTPA